MASTRRRLLLRPAAALALVGAPVYWLQGRRVRRETPRLEEAPGARSGAVPGAGPPLRLAGLGESPMAAVGLDDQAEGVVPRLASMAAAATGRRIDWATSARSGATARQALASLLPVLPRRRTDVVVIALGVNDCLALSGPARWRNDLSRLVTAVRERLEPGRILITGIPPMQHFPALPFPLSTMLGLRAWLLDAEAQALTRAGPDLIHAPMDFVEHPAGLFCRDGFHPNARAQALWAEQLLAPLLDEGACLGRRVTQDSYTDPG